MNRGAWWAIIHGITELNTTEQPTLLLHTILKNILFLLNTVSFLEGFKFHCQEKVLFLLK